jgi:hypothetical protein
MKDHLLLHPISTKDKGPFLMYRFSSIPNMEISTITSQGPRRRSRNLFTIFHKEVTGTPTDNPTEMAPYKSNKLTVSHSNKS